MRARYLTRDAVVPDLHLGFHVDLNNVPTDCRTVVTLEEGREKPLGGRLFSPVSLTSGLSLDCPCIPILPTVLYLGNARSELVVTSCLAETCRFDGVTMNASRPLPPPFARTS